LCEEWGNRECTVAEVRRKRLHGESNIS
jgi:hypothetical protein